MPKVKTDPEREDRITMEIVVDAYDENVYSSRSPQDVSPRGPSRL